MLLAAAFIACAAEEDEAPPPNPAEVLRSLPKSVTSSDGFIKVIAADVPGDDMGFRGPILQFSTEVVRALGRTLALPAIPRRREPGLVIYAQDGRTNDTRVVSRVTRRRSGVVTRVWLPSPGYSDLARFRQEVARAYFRTMVDLYVELPVKKGTPPPAELPEWLVDGVLRLADQEQARDDMRTVLRQWSTAEFAYFPRVCAGEGRSEAVAGYLAGWLREKKLFSAMLADYAAGRPWPGALIASRLTDETDPARQDEVSDQRLLRIVRKVISPGFTSSTDLAVFASRLMLYPSYFDQKFGSNGSGCTFHEALELYHENAELRRAAARKAKEVPLYALGRGEELQQASLAYMDFLLAVAADAEGAKVADLLAAADAKFEKVRVAVLRKEMER